MLRKLIERVKAAASPSRGGQRRSNRRTNRRQRIEHLEQRQLFAADPFVGVFTQGQWRLDGDPPAAVSFGLPGDQPVMGDWNGDGQKTPGIFRNGLWVLDITGNGFDHGDKVLHFGLPGDKAVAGDWNGNGVDTVGVYRHGAWFFDRDGNGYDPAVDSTPTFFGLPGDIPVPGDWNGNDVDTPGIYRNGTWVLDITGNGYDIHDRVLQFGLPGAQPVAGDWNGNGRDTPAVLQHGQWFFDLEGDGYTGEQGRPNTLGAGVAVSGSRPVQPVQLTRGTVHNGSIMRVGEIDQFQVHGRAGERMKLNVAVTPGSTLQLEVSVLKPGGATKFGNHVVSTTSSIDFSVTPGEQGTYTIQVRARDRVASGNYRLSLQSLSVPHVGPTAALKAGGTVTGQISGSAHSQQYLIHTQPRRRITIHITNLDPNGSFRPNVTLYSADGSRIRSVQVNQQTGTITISTNPNQGSPLLLHVQDDNVKDSGRYRLRYTLS